MNRKALIENKLQEAFAPTHLAVHDDSAKHAGHAGASPSGESHFTVEIVSEKFFGLSRINRHRLVNEALASLFQEGLHALAIHAKSPEE